MSLQMQFFMQYCSSLVDKISTAISFLSRKFIGIQWRNFRLKREGPSKISDFVYL